MQWPEFVGDSKKKSMCLAYTMLLKVIIKNVKYTQYLHISMAGEFCNYFHIEDENKNPNPPNSPTIASVSDGRWPININR